MSYLFTLALVAVFAAIWPQSDGHARFVCPPPQSADSGREEKVCRPFSRLRYTDITPGPQTIQIEETVFHKGSAMKIELMKEGGQPCLLLDHIPHNPDSDTTNCDAETSPVGQCGQSSYFLTIQIPDVNCEKCQLRLTYINMDSANGSRICATNPNNCTAYYSCSDVKIRGTSIDLSAVCPNNSPTWPYQPKYYFSSSLSPQKEVPPVDNSLATGSATLALEGNVVSYNIQYQGIDDFTMAHIHGPAQPDENAGIVKDLTPNFQSNGDSGSAVGQWTGLTDMHIEHLKKGEYYINIHSTSFPVGEIRGQISWTDADYAPNRYKSESEKYNSDGWIAGSKFLSPSSKSSRFLVGFGACAVGTTRYFGTGLQSPSLQSTIGTAAIQTTSNRAWFSLDVAGIPGSLQSVVIDSSAAYGAESKELIPDYLKTPAHVMGVFDLTENQWTALTQGGLRITVAFTDSSVVLQSTFEEGMIGMLANEFEKPPSPKSPNVVGTASLRFSRDGYLHANITVTGLTSTITKAHIHGPGRQQQTGPLLFDLSSYIWNVSDSDAHVTASVTFDDQSPMTMRYLWENRLYVNVHTDLAPTGEIRNQISKPGKWHCEGKININQCFASNLTTAQSQATHTVKLTSDGFFPPSGVAGVYIDRLGDLHYSIALSHISKSTITAAHIHGPAIPGSTGEALHTINHDDFAPKAGERDNVIELEGVWQDLSEIQKSFAKNGELYFNIHSEENPDGFVRGQLPKAERSRCGLPNKEITVTSSDQTVGFLSGHPYPDLRLLQYDVLNVAHSGNDKIYLLENKNRYDGCAYLNSKEISGTSPDPLQSFAYNLTEPGMLYFAGPEAKCNGSPPMKFIVTIKPQLAEKDRLDDSVCQQSNFASSVVEETKTGSSGAKTIAAVFIGIGVGVVIIVIVLVLNYRRSKSGGMDVKA